VEINKAIGMGGEAVRTLPTMDTGGQLLSQGEVGVSVVGDSGSRLSYRTPPRMEGAGGKRGSEHREFCGC